jgi:hypothetical protein
MAHRVQRRAAVLETSVVLGLLLFPVWVGLTFCWWIRLAPPRLIFARLYMVIGAAWSIWSCTQLVIAAARPALHDRLTYHAVQQHLGAIVLLAALYAEIFVRWLRVRSGVDRIAPARIVVRAGRRHP